MLVFTLEIAVVLGVMAVAILLFVTEWLRVDVTAMLVLVALGLISALPGVEPLVSAHQLFAGFSSNAVVSIIAVMIVGAGLDRAGLVGKIALAIIRTVKGSRKAVLPLLCATVGLISSFMQNVGAAAIFIPVVSRLSSRLELGMSRLLMPMGFAAILGGTLTLVGSSPLILLNDLLPAEYARFHLFEVSPIGIVLLLGGILYFLVLGPYLLPKTEDKSKPQVSAEFFRQLYGVDGEICMISIDADVERATGTIGEFEARYGIHVIALHGKEITVSPHRNLPLRAEMHLAVMVSQGQMKAFFDSPGIHRLQTEDAALVESLSPDQAGIAEIVIRPNAAVIGKTIGQVRIRQTYGITPLAIHRAEGVVRDNLRESQLQVGDNILCHVRWEDLAALEQDPGFVVVTSDYPKSGNQVDKLNVALMILCCTLGLVLFTDLRLSLCLMSGALAMVISGILTMDDAYRAVSWKTVFLLAGLIPLGTAVESSGTAAWVAQSVLQMLGDNISVLTLYITIAIMAGIFSLVMSNLGATIILIPLAIQLAINVGADPRMCALIVAVGVSNSFLIPTHQVNALIMGPGNYRVTDFVRVGGGMSLLFIATLVAVVMLWY